MTPGFYFNYDLVIHETFLIIFWQIGSREVSIITMLNYLTFSFADEHTALVIQWLSSLVRHCILLVPNFDYKRDYKIWGHMKENVSYASKRRGRFEAVHD